MTDIIVTPVALAALEAHLKSAAPPALIPERDYLTEAFGYYRRELTTLADPEVVIAAVKEILRHREEIQVLKVRLGVKEAARRRQSSAPTGTPIGVDAPGRSRC